MSSTVGRPVFILLTAVIVASLVALTLRALDARRAPPIVITDVVAERPVVVVVDGAVATPGVLTLPPGARLNDAILGAGGLTGSADANGLNLARLLVDGERVTVAELKPSTANSAIGRAGGAGTTGSPSIATGAAPASEPNGAPSTAGPTSTPASVAVAGELVDINTATAAELDALPGIGPVLAGRIVAYRDEHGPYATVDELEAVDGISVNTVEDLRPLVTAGGPA